MDYAKEILIDDSNLAAEWMEQPHKFMLVASAHADAKLEVAKLEMRIDVLSAEVDKNIRANPEKYGLEKITEGGVAKCVSANEKVQRLQSELAEAKHNVDILSAAVRAFDQRKDALENLVRLTTMEYFGEPVAKGSATKDHVRQALRDETKTRLRNTMRGEG